MKLAYWMYAGPAHIGTLRVASSFQNVHAIMHAPLGDDYFNVMRSMLERNRNFRMKLARHKRIPSIISAIQNTWKRNVNIPPNMEAVCISDVVESSRRY